MGWGGSSYQGGLGQQQLPRWVGGAAATKVGWGSSYQGGLGGQCGLGRAWAAVPHFSYGPGLGGMLCYGLGWVGCFATAWAGWDALLGLGWVPCFYPFLPLSLSLPYAHCPLPTAPPLRPAGSFVRLPGTYTPATLLLAWEYKGGWRNIPGAVAMTVLTYLLGGGNSFSSGRC